MFYCTLSVHSSVLSFLSLLVLSQIPTILLAMNNKAYHIYVKRIHQLLLLSLDQYFVLQCMGEAGVDGAVIVQPINHKFDHSLVTR